MDYELEADAMTERHSPVTLCKACHPQIDSMEQYATPALRPCEDCGKSEDCALVPPSVAERLRAVKS